MAREFSIILSINPCVADVDSHTCLHTAQPDYPLDPLTLISLHHFDRKLKFRWWQWVADTEIVPPVEQKYMREEIEPVRETQMVMLSGVHISNLTAGLTRWRAGDIAEMACWWRRWDEALVTSLGRRAGDIAGETGWLVTCLWLTGDAVKYCCLEIIIVAILQRHVHCLNHL